MSDSNTKKVRQAAIKGLKVGDTFTASRTFTEGDMDCFAHISRDFNPVHFSKKFAQLKGFDDRICHGLLVAGLMTEIGGQIGWLATGMDFRFKRPVYFGDTISCSFTIVEMGEKGWVRAEYTYTNQDKVVVLDGVITGFLPGPEEKEVMKRLVSEADPTDKN